MRVARTTTLALTLALLGILATGCPKQGGPVEGQELVGEWADTGSAIYTLAIVNRQLRLMSVVDNDGEVFEVRKSGWAGGHFTIDYHVPSTGYDVTITLIEQVREGVWMTYWVNAYDNGNEEWTKVD